MYLFAVSTISLRSSADVSFMPACKHCLTAASQPILENIKVIAGRSDIRSSFSIISARESLFESSIQRDCLPPLVRTFRRASLSNLRISGLISPGFVNKSANLLPINTC